MDGGSVNNPLRVPPLLTAIDGPQAGAPRVIHPIGLAVGVPGGSTSMDTSAATFLVPEDGTFMDDFGSPIQYRKGDHVPAARAREFPSFREQMEPDAGAFVPAVTRADYDEAVIDSAELRRARLEATENVAADATNDGVAVGSIDPGTVDDKSTDAPEVVQPLQEPPVNAEVSAPSAVDENKETTDVTSTDSKPAETPAPKPPKALKNGTRSAGNAPENRAEPTAPENR